MTSQTLLRILIVTSIILSCAMASRGQQTGQWLPGQRGLDGGMVPPPGFTYVNETFTHSASELNSPMTGNASFVANENIFFYVPDHEVLGGHYAPFVIVTVLSNTVNANLAGISLFGAGTGLTDLLVEPAHIGWRFKRVDLSAGYGFVVPVGRFNAEAADNVGLGYWGHHVNGGVAVYLTQDRKTSAHLFTDWEAHGQMQDTNITPGQAFTTEWGLGHVFALKKNNTKLLQPGIIGYDQWQLTDNRGAAPSPFYSVHAIGLQNNFILPVRDLTFVFKYENEYHAVARPQGQLFVFGVAWSWRHPAQRPPGH